MLKEFAHRLQLYLNFPFRGLYPSLLTSPVIGLFVCCGMSAIQHLDSSLLLQDPQVNLPWHLDHVGVGLLFIWIHHIFDHRQIGGIRVARKKVNSLLSATRLSNEIEDTWLRRDMRVD